MKYTEKNKEEKQEIPVKATQWEPSCKQIWTALQTHLADFATEETNGQHTWCGPSKDLTLLLGP